MEGDADAIALEQRYREALSSEQLEERLKSLHMNRDMDMEHDVLTQARSLLGKTGAADAGVSLENTLSSSVRLVAQDDWQRALELVEEECRERDATQKTTALLATLGAHDGLDVAEQYEAATMKQEVHDPMMHAQLIAEAEAQERRARRDAAQERRCSPQKRDGADGDVSSAPTFANRWEACKASAAQEGGGDAVPTTTAVTNEAQPSSRGGASMRDVLAAKEAAQECVTEAGLSSSAPRPPATERVDLTNFDLDTGAHAIVADSQELKEMCSRRLERWSKYRTRVSLLADVQQPPPESGLTAGAAAMAKELSLDLDDLSKMKSSNAA